MNDDPNKPEFDRRQILKAGAWAAPVIAVAAAVPAASASVVGGALVYDYVGLQHTWDNDGHRVGVETWCGLRLSAGTGTAESITLILTLSNPDDLFAVGATPTLPQQTDPRWSVAGPGQSDGSGNITFTFTWSGSLGLNEQTGELRADIPATRAITTEPISWTSVATTPGATGAAGSGVLPFSAEPPEEQP